MKECEKRRSASRVERREGVQVEKERVEISTSREGVRVKKECE